MLIPPSRPPALPPSLPQWAPQLRKVRQGRPTFDEEVEERERQKAQEEADRKQAEANRIAAVLSPDALAALWLGD